MNKHFRRGLAKGVPIAIGYIADGNRVRCLILRVRHARVVRAGVIRDRLRRFRAVYGGELDDYRHGRVGNYFNHAGGEFPQPAFGGGARA